MKQVLVAACVGITVGWIGFGWVLAEAPGEGVVMAGVQGGHGSLRMSALGGLGESLGEQNLRG